MSSFLHGVEVIDLASGSRPIRGVRSAVIGLVGSAPKGPLNTPTLVVAGNKTDAAQFGSGHGTISQALKDIAAQAGALVVVVNVLDPTVHKAAVTVAEYTFDSLNKLTVAHQYIRSVVLKNQAGSTTYVLDTDYSYDSDTGEFTRLTGGAIASLATVKINYDRVDETAVTNSDIIGEVDEETGARTGVQALLDAMSIVKVQPKILIAPGYSGKTTLTGEDITGGPIASALVTVSDKLRAIVVSEGPNTNDADAITFRELFGSKRLYIVDPYAKIYDTEADDVAQVGNSALVAGLIAGNDDQNGFWTSPSNRELGGIVGTARAVDFALEDPNCRANLLNENEVATIVQMDGYRLWGNRTASSDPLWAFLSHVRLHDMILEALLRAHLWAVDRNITKTYKEDVVEGVNSYLRQLAGQGAISGGTCWFSGDVNTAETMDAGQVYFDFDYGRYGVAERVTFRAAVNNDYTVTAVFG